MNILQPHIDRLSSQLQTRRFGRETRWLDAVDSTNTLAAAWAKEGAQTGALIVADYQREGRGRFDRSWEANQGENLTFSLVINAEDLGSDFGFLPIALAVAIAETLADYIAPHQPRIKWPNDLLLVGRKLGGILTESSIRSKGMSQYGYAVAGIGLNVNQNTFKGGLSTTATSVFQITGRKTDRLTLLCDLLLSIESACDGMAAGQIDRLIERYQSKMAGINDTVRFSRVDSGLTGEGTILGVDPGGALLVRTTAGVETIRAGEVTLGQSSQPLPSR